MNKSGSTGPSATAGAGRKVPMPMKGTVKSVSHGKLSGVLPNKTKGK